MADGEYGVTETDKTAIITACAGGIGLVTATALRREGWRVIMSDADEDAGLREADRIGAIISGRPLWLASALNSMQSAAQKVVNQSAEGNPATAHMFIINPLRGRKFAKLFSTHPPTKDRVARLRAMAVQMDGGR